METICFNSTAAPIPVVLQVLGSLPVVKDGVLTKGQADSQVGRLSLWGRLRMLQDAHDVLIDPYKRLTAFDMGAKPLLSRSA